MSYHLQCENGSKVNMIKQKFEQNASPKEKQKESPPRATDEHKDSLRRSLSASPVKSKKNFKLNVSRQLSNPGKNIKRTPAFRGDKLSRTKNLQSPTKERLPSIVNQNVKMFEERPEYGKIGNVKKKSYDTVDCGTSSLESFICDRSTPDSRKPREDCKIPIDRAGSRYNGWKDCKPPRSKDSRMGENTVRTTIISRQKNISPIYTRDDELASTNGKPVDSPRLDKFLKNGVEYTKVTKQSRQSSFDSISRTTEPQQNSRYNACSGTSILDIREELSRRIRRKAESNENLAVHRSDEVIDGSRANEDDDLTTRKSSRHELDESSRRSLTRGWTERLVDAGLTETLKAALQAPLPAGPPPKKPPRTFAHSPVTGFDTASPESHGPLANGNHSDDDHPRLPEDTRSPARTEGRTAQDKSRTGDTSKRSPGSDKLAGHKSRESRDSKKMLEKLEHVLIQHQKALGPKVIMARKDRHAIANGFDVRDAGHGESTTSDSEKREKRSFPNRLSRTLEDSKKLGSLPKTPDSKTRKHSTFDCLPSLNCASSSVYEQVKHPDFKSYFAETSSLRESQSSISKSEDSLETSITNLLMGNSEFYDDLASSPASKRLSTELSTFLDGKRRQTNRINSEERVYAEPFAFDKNSGTDITGYGMLSPEEHNYFSRSLREERFGSCKENSILRCERGSNDETGSAKPELHYMVRARRLPCVCDGYFYSITG